MELLIFAGVFIIYVAIIFAGTTTSNTRKRALRGIFNRHNHQQKPTNSEGPIIEKHVEIDMSLISEPVHTIAKLIADGNIFKVTTHNRSQSYMVLNKEHYCDWVVIRHLEDSQQSSCILFNGHHYSLQSVNCGGRWYQSSFDWMEQEELKYLFHVGKDNYERLAVKAELEYKTKKRQEAIDFYTKTASGSTQEGV